MPSKHYPFHTLVKEGNVYSDKHKKFVRLCPDKDGYAICGVKLKDGRRQSKRVHRMIAIEFIPNPQNKPQVNHIDGNKWNNHINNLEWVTAKENRKRAVDTGLLKDKGQDNGNSKLSSSEVYRIRALYATGLVKQAELATLFGVSQPEVGNIIRRENWKD